MARVSLYSSSRRSKPVDRQAVLASTSPAPGAVASPKGAADTQDSPPRHGWITAVRRFEKPLLILAASCDQILAVIDQQSDVQRRTVEVRSGELLDPLLERGAGDAERVDRVRLAALA